MHLLGSTNHTYYTKLFERGSKPDKGWFMVLTVDVTLAVSDCEFQRTCRTVIIRLFRPHLPEDNCGKYNTDFN